MANPTRSNRNQKAINRWTSRIIPVILIGIVAYVTWVIIAHTCGELLLFMSWTRLTANQVYKVDYLLRSSTSSSYGARPRLATAVVTLYSILLFLISIAYFRLLYTVATNPGYVPRGPQWHALHKRGTRQQRPGWIRRQTRFEDYEEKPQHTSGSGDIETGNLGGFVYGDEVKTSRPKVADEASLVLQDFYGKDVFTCEGNGRPIWCTSCYNWKPDRAHHCSEVGRCVRKMDHFCPW